MSRQCIGLDKISRAMNYSRSLSRLFSRSTSTMIRRAGKAREPACFNRAQNPLEEAYQVAGREARRTLFSQRDTMGLIGL